MSDQTVGSYVLIEKLGEGGMGEVYLADHKYIARRAAIKFLLRDLSGSTELVGRFFAEARAASVIKHPGIVEVLDCDVHEDGRAYIVMELLLGESLRDYIGRVGGAGRDEPGALAIFLQIGAALAAAHAQEIIHRDLKPDNVFLHLPAGSAPSEPIVKVLDFGIAKLMGRGEGGTKTRTGQLLGTPMYMSPEQCRGAKQIDSRSDIYSLGCIMYEVLCGRPPFLEEGFGDLIIAHVSQPPPEPLETAPWMTRATREILLACLAKDARDRPQSMALLVGMLARAGASETIHLQHPVVMVARPAAGRGASSDNRSPVAAPRSGPRLAQTTPMSKSIPASAQPAGMTAPSTPGAFAATPVGAGRTRLLPDDLRSSPNTLQDGASERLQPTLRTRGGRGGKVVIGLGAIGAVALAATLIIRALTPPLAPSGASHEPAPEIESAPGKSATTSPSGVTEHRAAAENLPPAAPPPAPAASLIQLDGLPANATVHLDGKIVAPPLRVARLSGPHRVLVEAPGYQPAELAVDGESDRTIAVDLKKLVVPIAKPAAPKNRKRSDDSPHAPHAPHESPGFKAFTDL